MKKIIYIDDTKNRLEEIKKLVNDSKFIDIHDKILLFDSIDSIANIKSGNIQNLNNQINWQDIEYIFLHKSLNDPRIPENIVMQIKELLPEGVSLFTFSGSSTNNIKERILNRNTLEVYFSDFLKFAKEFHIWFIPVLYNPNNYKLHYASFLLREIKNKTFDSFQELTREQAYKDLIRLMDWDNKIIYSKHNNPIEFLEQAKNIIESNKLKRDE